VPAGRRWVLVFALGTACVSTSHVGFAEEPAVEGGEAGARKHFQRALELYRAGHYTEALPELERAAELDPNGKDLFFNLSLVHEKLGQLPEAIANLSRFLELETDVAEKERARLTIERLRGARAAGEAPKPAVAATEPCPTPPRPLPVNATRAAPSPVLIGAASLAAVSFVVGSVFGIKALNENVSDTPTSADLPVSRLRERARRAERDALVADVAFALGAASTATFVTVWWLSPREPATRAAGVTLRGEF